MIQFENITIERGGHKLLESVNLRIRANAKAVVIGPSGSGKTSLLLSVMGLFRPSTGRILFKDRELTTDTVHTVRRHIAYISQEPVMGADTVEDALMIPFVFRANRKISPEKEQIVRILNKLRLDSSILGKRTVKISAGEKQRIAVARALLMEKGVFLVDEATSALDGKSKAAVADILLADGVTVFSVSHDDYWIGRCHPVFEIENHRIGERVTDGDD